LYCVHLTSTLHSPPKPPYIPISSYSWLYLCSYWWNPSRIRTRQSLIQLLAVLTLLTTNSRKERQMDYEIQLTVMMSFIFGCTLWLQRWDSGRERMQSCTYITCDHTPNQPTIC
jgi:hypothetical protein